ncbi:hypothetical protein R69746_08777 [Paraburkholderia aspalathi]|nr:hypothetical protein R69746_08777 [Paraburkholderia aspalathi]
MNAIEALREMNRSDARKVPVDAPTAFVKPRWGRFVFKEGGIDRRFYELAAMSELKNALRSGDVSVIGSRRFKDFDEYLMPRATFDDQHRGNRLGLLVETSAAAYLDERLARLREALDETARLAVVGELPDVELNDKGLKITPLDDANPAAADILMQQVYDLMPRVKITDLLLEVDQWTDFTRHFTHLKSDSEPPDRTLLLTALLADAFNLGLEKMADACPGTSVAKLSWLVAWYIRDETYQKGLAELVNYQHGLPFAHIGAKARPRHPMVSDSAPVGTVKPQDIATQSMATNPACCFIRTSPISTRRSTPRSSIRRCVMPPTCSMACCITSRSCVSRSTTRTPLVLPITCLRCATS